MESYIPCTEYHIGNALIPLHVIASLTCIVLERFVFGNESSRLKKYNNPLRLQMEKSPSAFAVGWFC